MAFGTALYGFLGLLFASRVAREYVDERWAFLATIADLVGQLASRIHVLQSVVVARAFGIRGRVVPLVLARNAPATHRAPMVRPGVIAGLMLNVYYANGCIASQTKVWLEILQLCPTVAFF